MTSDFSKIPYSNHGVRQRNRENFVLSDWRCKSFSNFFTQLFLILPPFALTLCQAAYFLLRVQARRWEWGVGWGRGVILPNINKSRLPGICQNFNLHVKMLDILVRFYGKTRKSINLYYSINNIVLFPNRIKGN